jgi:hypothetical protein
MLSGRRQFDAVAAPADALARGQGLLDALGPQQPVAVYGAELAIPSVVLGAYQHAPQALRAQAFEAIAVPVVRRSTGGAAVWAAPGVLYVALALADASVLMACPPGRILNRNVRGVLAGLRALHVPAHYFGRDFISVNRDPCAYVGWAERGDGRVLLEFFVGVETAFALPPGLDGYPEREAPALRGKSVTTLRAAGAHHTSTADVFESIVHGYGKTHDVAFEAKAFEAPVEHAARLAPVDDERGLCWSAPREDAIGFVSAGVKLDAQGKLAALEVGGDFYQHDACPEQLAARLLGHAPTADAIGAALDAVYAARPGLIEGVRSLTILRDAIVEAVQRAAARD